MKKILAILILVSFAAFAACEGTASHYLPAVVDSGGVLVNVTLQLTPGTGDIFMSINPKIGLATQESVADAVDYAFNVTEADQGRCDVKIKAYLPARVGGYLDGPSGGAAITLMGISAIENKPMRGDALITGTISPDGTIGPVGGLYEKAKIARENGLAYFITPMQTLYERILLRLVQEEGGITVYEARNITQAAKFMILGMNISGEKNPPMVEQVNDSLPKYSSDASFKPLADGMTALFNSSAARIDPQLAKDEKLDAYFSQLNANERTLIGKGYYFSAANDAFIAYLDSETIANVDSLDVASRISSARTCLASLPQPRLTTSNYEWAAGEELRRSWAEKKLEDLSSINYTLKEEKYLAYHEAMYADGWCRIAKLIADNAPSGGAQFPESSLANLSAKYLAQAQEQAANSSSQDVVWHLENAEKLHSEGRYAGAILDSVFSIEMSNASAAFSDNEEAALAQLRSLVQQKRDSLWGDVYASHGAYLLWQGDNATAFNLVRFAKGLDNADSEMRAAMPAAPAAQIQPGLIYAAGAIILIAALAAAAYFYSARTGAAQRKPNVFKSRKRQ